MKRVLISPVPDHCILVIFVNLVQLSIQMVILLSMEKTMIECNLLMHTCDKMDTVRTLPFTVRIEQLFSDCWGGGVGC